MTEPASTAVGGLALYKLGVLGILSTVLVAIVVMSMTLPRSGREFVVAMISTVVASLGGGAFVIRWLEIGHWINDDIGLIGLGAVVFVCGLPAWVSVRAWFAYTEASKGRTLLELIRELRGAVKGEG
ncbi:MULTISPECIES: hypothetical protein [Pseudomonas]|uniref:Bacteriophage protein n=1 Tax=Pseudomonas solani TaxID=2731552 RepID=A0AAU7Y4G4_9PSED|nr:hypothetical protein [Pseudomonas tohonis]GJN49454.1 hypothetical protein TUM20249_54400 [Pseudomonas tohonis]